MGIRKHRRNMRSIFKEGLEAAFRADPEVLEKCKPKTSAGRFVIGLVLEAGKGRAISIRTVMSLIDWEEEPPANSEEILDRTEWDWNEEGEWQTFPEAKADEAEDDDEDGEFAGAKEELKRRLTGLLNGNPADRVRAHAIMDRIRAGEFDDPPTPRAGSP